MEAAAPRAEAGETATGEAAAGEVWDVVVVGAGAAGLCAAEYLRRAGVRRVLVLEAHDEVGGRCRADWATGAPVDVGAGACEMRLARRGCEHTAGGGPMEDGKELEAELGESVLILWEETMMELLGETCETAFGFLSGAESCQRSPRESTLPALSATSRHSSAQNSRKCAGHDSIQAALFELRSRELDAPVHVHPEEREVYAWYEQLLKLACAADLSAVSLHSLRRYPATRRPWNAFFGWIPPLGIALELHRIGRRLSVQTGAVVTKICAHSNDGARAPLTLTVRCRPATKEVARSRAERQGREQSQCSDESSREICAKKAIVTVSVGVLRSKMISFVPELPQYKQTCYDTQLAMGLLNKVVLLFNRVFWPCDRDFFGALSEEATAPLFLSMARIDPGTPIVIAFVGGHQAVQLEATDSTVAQSSVDKIVDDFFDTVGHVRSDELVAVSVSRWHSDSYIRGSHSYVTTQGNGHEAEDLERPIDDRIYFAGEATSSTHPGTLLGALCSGVRAAQRALNEPLDDSKLKSLVQELF